MLDKIYIGIDPGVDGAIAVIGENGEYLEVVDMPVESRGNKRQVCPVDVWKFISRWAMNYDLGAIGIEEVHAMPKQGVTSSFNFGMSYGVVCGIAGAFGCRVVRVRPTKWKREFSLLKKDKDESRTRAKEIFVGIETLNRKKDVDRAEALLIALHTQGVVG